MTRGALRATPLVLLSITLVTGLAGCGSSHYTYVKNSAQKTYFKVPANWNKIEQRTLDESLGAEDPDSASARVRTKLTWAVAYDASKIPTPSHLYGYGFDSPQPFVHAIIQPLSPDQQGVISLNTLRDSFLPVTAERREAATEQLGLSGFELLRDDVLTPGHGIRGVRITYNYRIPAVPLLQTFDVTSYVSDDGRLYRFVIRCSAKCYQDRSGELDAIAKSFTVRKR
jgi:hypothetical protein